MRTFWFGGSLSMFGSFTTRMFSGFLVNWLVVNSKM